MNPADRLRGRLCLAALFAIFIYFTWRGVTMFYSGDDMMNTYEAWILPSLKLWKAQVLPWMPAYRPLGGAVYRIFYAVFGFHPIPLYYFCWLMLAGNVFAAWKFFRTLTPSVFEALTALSLTLVHGLFQDLYLSAGTVYDRLCFLFTVLAVIVYARARRTEGGLRAGRVALICLICMMAMNSKESGATVPAILFCYECVYCLPGAWRESRLRQWAISIAPLYGLLGAIMAAFVFGRVHGTPDLAANPFYQTHVTLGTWLTRVAEYLSILLYREMTFTVASTAVTLVAMLALAVLLRNRAMVFGWLYFVLAITPVATIPSRPGYVLYVPDLGLGLYFAALMGLGVQRLFARQGERRPEALSFAQVAIFSAVTVLVTWAHARHWPAPWQPHDSPEWRLTDKFRHDYPTLKPGAKILFAADYAPLNSYDLLFNLSLLYHDPTIEVRRMQGPADQRPVAGHPLEFDHVITTGLDRYEELDNHNAEESIRLNILKDHWPGHRFDTARRDRIGYVVSGVLITDTGDTGWWTTRSAKFKFDVYPVDSTLALKFWVPDFVAIGAARNLQVLVNGEKIGAIALTHDGSNEVKLPVPARSISSSGFTILGLDVDNPYTKDGQEFGVILLQASFDYAAGR